MKSLMTATCLAAVAALLPVAASAQTSRPGTTFYGTLGYDDSAFSHINLGSIQGRLGARFGHYFGVEGELAAGVKDDKLSVAGVQAKIKQDSQEAIYGVGFLPLSENFDLLARLGYGHTSGTGPTLGLASAVDGESWNYGVGAQYSFDGKNGVRLDCAREAFQRRSVESANVWSLAYVRRF